MRALPLLGVVLLMGVFIRHDTAFSLSNLTGIPPPDVFYMMGGAWEVALCAVLLLVFMAYTRSLWVDLARAAMIIGMVEGSMLAGCSLFQMTRPPANTTICDHVAGFPVGTVVLILEVSALFAILGYWVWKNGDAA